MSAAAEGVAIVGIAGRWPGAASLGEFWANLLAGRESITRFSPEELSPLVPAELRNHPRYVRARGVLADADRFDAAFFGIAPGEALLMDPQQRVFLELCWNALEHAGMDPKRFPGNIGVYAGTSNNTYRKLVESKPELVQAAGEFAAMLANEKDYVATRVAHRLDLHGPALSLHTACSTSLVAVAEAWYALMSWRCDLALAGGINIVVPQESGYLPVEGGMESEDGHCRPFDAAAGGTVFSSGGAAVALKRESEAIADGDFIWAVIRGVGVNNDGGEKASFTAPSVRGQSAVIRQALASADISAESIGYVEAHGTGTQLGDPIEVEALTRAFREDGQATQYCWLGSVKSNFGHLVAASGVTGLIKTALSLHHERIPGTLHYRVQNPEIDFGGSPFKVADHLIEWPRGAAPRRAGVSSFGVGGTNAHVVLEEAPVAAPASGARRFTVLPLSARDDSALQRRAANLSEALQSSREEDLADVGYTLATGRRPMRVRAAVVAANIAEARERLSRVMPQHFEAAPGVVFLFPGQGSQHAGMARELVDAEPVFREHFDHCCALASGYLQRDLRALILPLQNTQAAEAALAETRYTQPALFAVEYALAKLWESWGIVPRAMLGHSSGEYVAAALAGVFALEDAIALVCARGAAMFAQPPGAMLAVRAAAAQLSTQLPEGVEIAALNAPALTIVSGSDAATGQCESRLTAAGIASTRLRVSHAYHSVLMEGALPVFRRAFENVRMTPSQREFYSCVTGAPITVQQATSAEYWCNQLRRPVQFSAAFEDASSRRPILFLEIGPSRALTTLARSMLGGHGRAIASLGSAAQPGDAAEQAQRALAECWSAGVEPAWDEYYAGQRRRRVPLPGYPFHGERYWIEGPAATESEPNTGEIMGDSPQRNAGPDAAKRTTRLGAELRELLGTLHGEPIAPESEQASFLELGFDSLALTQAALEIERRYGVKLKFRRLMEDLDSIARLSAMLEQHLPSETGASVTGVSAGGASADPALAQLIESQMALMQQQSQLLAALAGGRTSPPASLAAAPAIPASRATEEQQVPNLVERPFGASARIHVRRDTGLTPAQRAFIDVFTRRYNTRTARSKTFTQQNRAVMADPRVVTGFNPLWKELVYPIVVERSRGARMWDIDGNEYIDLLNGFGANFLGYQPRYIKDALKQQIDAGFEIGPQHPLAAEVSALITELTGMQRVALCNTGSEAVMGAMRVARTVTGRKTIAIFKDSYHGIFDEVIVRGTPAQRPVPAAPGILPEAVANVLVLEYGSEESLRVLRERARELAAVMIEPVQSRNPTLQPRAFVQQLRAISDAAGCALIFDEVITGFRIEPGGAQAFYGVRADIATYGKIIGGGLPFAAIAGSAKWMDALDGGDWRFGDDSYPEAGVTYFAGTFVRHPLALAAARAALLHVRQRGPALQRGLNERTAGLVARLNAFFATRGAPMRALAFSSLWRVNVDTDQACASLYYYALRERGLHLYEQFNCFLSEAHGEAEVNEIASRIEAAVDELMQAGALTPRGGEEPVVADGQIDRATREGAGKAITAANLPNEIPLTDAQTEKWLSCQYGGLAELTCNESVLLTLDGALDRIALERALSLVFARHEAFALSFSRDGGAQRINSVPPLVPEFVDLHGGDPEARLEAHCAQELRRPFDLARAPLVRAQLLRVSPQRHALLIVAHHLVFDGWSEAVLLQELAQAYNAYTVGRDPELPPAESYRAYALAERARRAQPEVATQLEYWKQVYATPPAPLDLPGDRAPTAQPEFAAATERYVFPAPWVRRIRDAARSESVTLYALLLAGVGVLLSRLCNRHDFAVAVPFAGQAIAGSDHLIGDGVDTLPLRLNAESNQSFSAFVRAVHRSLLDAADNQDLTLFTLLRALPGRGAEARRLGEIIFNLNPRVARLEFDGLRHGARDCAKAALFQDLFFNLTETGEEVTLDLHYHTALFDAETIRRWIGIYQTLLTSAAKDGACSLAALPLLDETERRQVLHAGHGTVEPLGEVLTLPAMIAAQAARTPERIAVQGGDQAWSYARLEQYADAIADVLRTRGVDRGESVGIHLSRRPEMLGALLGVLRSGAAYVPLDPTLPVERLRYMAERAEMKRILTWSAEETPEALSEGRELLALGGFDAVSAPQAKLPEISGDDPAYVIYTSGSTGKPKGVRVLHRNLANFVSSMRTKPGIERDDVLCAVTTLSFDISGLELYVPLTVGARIVLASDEQHRDPAALARLLRETGATVLQTTPSLLRVLVDVVPPLKLRELKLLIGGEALPRDLAEHVLPHCRELWNLYGPTETTIWSALHRVNHEEGPVPLGKPIANTRLHVLDERHQPVPEGVIGEIWIGGAGVAEGYLRDPQQTAERFVPDPFAQDGSRMYRTGDLGSLQGGELHFHGRIDEQIKLRGHRIEPGEIETLALAQPEVREAVAVVREIVPGDDRLVLYVSASLGGGISVERLRDTLREKLPAYMLPQHIEVVGTLPKTSSGKIDRKALSLPAGIAPADTAAPDAESMDALERSFIEIWRDLLRVERVGLHDNFFDLGGDSLLAVRVFQRAQEITGVNLPLATLLMAPTIAGQCSAFRAAGAKEPKAVFVPAAIAATPAAHDHWSPLVPIQSEGSRTPLFCVHAVGGNVLNYVPLAKSLGPDQPFYGLQAVGLDGLTPPLESLPAMASLYISEIRKVQPRGPYLLSGGSMGGMIAYEMACQLREQGEEVALLALFDTFGPGNRLFEIARAGSIERMGHRWTDRLKRLRNNGNRAKMLWTALFWRVQRVSDLGRSKWLHSRAKPLPHAMRYRLIELSHERAYFAYDPRQYDGPIVLFRAATHPEEMNASRTLGWEKVATGRIEVVDLPGSHDDLIEQPALAEGLRETLRQIQSQGSAVARASRKMKTGSL